jgi:hypothetical protein
MEASCEPFLIPYHSVSLTLLLLASSDPTYLAGEVGSTTLRSLKNDGGALIASRLESSDDGRRGCDVLERGQFAFVMVTEDSYDSWDGVFVLLGVLEESCTRSVRGLC